ncbi:hypothetical protein [Paracraurococcus lichenis]|uniref:Uncharacterized protein n=1 Tax=Paracraurococcus lichenis TaxID=3064888 RepID=A0ABT9E7D9_9PROT|nr:hypothetical protein [Paracraurococcus sp. LOR1-02]MDO9711980.1 hypothetical protein [Paracraurococcus sp. LOR1-02]
MMYNKEGAVKFLEDERDRLAEDIAQARGHGMTPETVIRVTKDWSNATAKAMSTSNNFSFRQAARLHRVLKDIEAAERGTDVLLRNLTELPE